jgi:hypothetical protein
MAPDELLRAARAREQRGDETDHSDAIQAPLHLFQQACPRQLYQVRRVRPTASIEMTAMRVIRPGATMSIGVANRPTVGGGAI